MGLLDDAIREHLELKRRHGASDEEIAQKETEALGPARRDFPVPQQAEPEPEADEAGVAPAGIDDEPGFEADEAAVAPAGIDEPEVEGEPALGDGPEVQDTPALEPDPAPEPAPFEDAPAAEDEEEPEDGASDDVLEETPEFLQDAPEHDRLWFEQKPPRDFDFD